MRLRPGFILWAITLIALFVLQHTRLRPFPHILLLFWLLLIPAAWINLHLAKKNLVLRLHNQSDIERNTPFSVEIAAENRSRFTAARLRMNDGRTDQICTVLPESVEFIPYTTHAMHTGAFFLPDHPIRLEEPFGLFQTNIVPEDNRIWVLPLQSADDYSLQEGLQGQSPRTAPFREGRDETAYVEPYTRGRSMRHIHWKLSARMQQWLTRHMDDETDPILILAVLGPEGTEPVDLDKKDRMYDFSYAVCASALRKGRPLRLFHEGRISDVYTRTEQIPMIRRLLAMQAAQTAAAPVLLRSVRSTGASVAVLLSALDAVRENELIALRTRVHRLEVFVFDEVPAEQSARMHASGVAVHPLESENETL